MSDSARLVRSSSGWSRVGTERSEATHAERGDAGAIAANGPISTAIRIPELAVHGVHAFTTTRAAGSFGLASDEPVQAVMGRWSTLMDDLRALGAPALATAGQVHGSEVLVHAPGWRGWLRGKDTDGHATRSAGLALAVTIADCTPVFLVHPGGALSVLHAGWRGTAADILERGILTLAELGAPADELSIHLGPAICGACYEVGPEVVQAVLGRASSGKSMLDVREALADRARRAGCTDITISEWCTRCHGDRLYSHRRGDAGRQLAVIVRV